MMTIEFTERTGYKPTPNEYKDIEEAYYNCSLDKDEFCKKWKEENAGRIADQRKADKKASLLDKAVKTEERLSFELRGVYRYADITPRVAKQIIEYRDAQATIRRLGGKPRFSSVANEYEKYAENLLDIEY